MLQQVQEDRRDQELQLSRELQPDQDHRLRLVVLPLRALLLHRVDHLYQEHQQGLVDQELHPYQGRRHIHFYRERRPYQELLELLQNFFLMHRRVL